MSHDIVPGDVVVPFSRGVSRGAYVSMRAVEWFLDAGFVGSRVLERICGRLEDGQTGLCIAVHTFEDGSGFPPLLFLVGPGGTLGWVYSNTVKRVHP